MSTHPASDEVKEIYDAVEVLIARCEAVEDPHTFPWNTIESLRAAQYDLHAAFAYLALFEEGRHMP